MALYGNGSLNLLRSGVSWKAKFIQSIGWLLSSSFRLLWLKARASALHRDGCGLNIQFKKSGSSDLTDLNLEPGEPLPELTILTSMDLWSDSGNFLNFWWFSCDSEKGWIFCCPRAFFPWYPELPDQNKSFQVPHVAIDVLNKISLRKTYWVDSCCVPAVHPSCDGWADTLSFRLIYTNTCPIVNLNAHAC